MITYLVLVLQFLCLAVWVGGATVLLSIVAPSAGRKTGEDAVDPMLIILKRFYGLLALLQLLLLATLSLQLLLLSGSLGLKLRLALSIVSAAMLLSVHFRFTVLPRLLSRRSATEDGSAEARQTPRPPSRSLMPLAANLFLGLSVIIILLLPF